MAKKKKKKSTRAPAKANRSKSTKKRYGKKNPGVTMAMIKRAMGSKKKKKGHGKRNPAWLGMSSRDAFGNSAAVLGAVTVAKLVPPMLPAEWSSTDLKRFLTTLGVAIGEVTLAHFLFPKYRTMVLAGAGAQTLSVALNPVLRKFSSNITLGRIQQRRGMNDFVAGNFPEPHNPIWQKMAVAAMAVGPGTTSGGGNIGRYHKRYA